jgi:hypothetical protein
LDASNPERKRGKKREVSKKKKISVLKSVILEERALRQQHRAFHDQSGSVGVQEEGGVTADSSAGINDAVLSAAGEIQGCSCVTDTGEVTGDDIRKDEGVNITEVLNLTESLKENLSLSRSCQTTTLSDVSDGLECTEEMISKVDRGGGNCTMVPSGLLQHGVMEELWRLSVHSRKFRE